MPRDMISATAIGKIGQSAEHWREELPRHQRRGLIEAIKRLPPIAPSRQHSTARAQLPSRGPKGSLPSSIIDIEKYDLGTALRQHVGPGHEQAVLGAGLEMKACAAGPGPDRHTGERR